MSDVSLHRSGPPETILPDEPADALGDLEAARVLTDPDARRRAVAEVIARHPTCLEAWADLGDAARDDVEAYAAYRVGYHRGLDRLRQNGWRGSGYVRWRYRSNQGFLRALDGLRRQAAVIGERDEQERCALFLRQLDPGWPPEERRETDDGQGRDRR